MKSNSKEIFVVAGVLCFLLALFQVIIGLSPSLSLYFGAPEALTINIYALVAVSILIGGLLAVFGLYAFSGAGYIRTLPWMKQVLVLISCIFIIRGLLIVPEICVIIGILQTKIHVAQRFLFFSLGSLIIGLIFLIGTIRFQKMGCWKYEDNKHA